MTGSTEKQAALSFLKGRSVATLATLSPDNEPRARTIYYVANNLFEVFFFTLAGTRKVVDINHDHRAALVITDENAPQTLQMEGVLLELPDATIAEPHMQELLDVLTKRGSHFAPLTHMDASAILFYKLTPTWIRWGDFTTQDGSENVFKEITP